MRKLKQSEVKEYREAMLKAQGGLCAFCGQDCKKPCLDHAHMEPHKDKVRGVICNFCNIALGKLENARVRTGTSWEDFQTSFPRVHGYVWGFAKINPRGFSMDWHPSKRKSEVTAFRKMKAGEQLMHLLDTFGKDHDIDGWLAVKPRNATERVAFFRKLNNKG